MNIKTIATIAAAGLLSLTAFGQTSPTPPTPPAPPAAPPPPGRHFPDDGRRDEPKVPVTWLGVETSEVPRVVSEQLGLPRGFGLVVDYVVPDGPAAAGGVQQSDILKMLNDQILTEPDQLAKLVRSFQDGTTVTLTVLRKGAEQKLQVKLAKKEMSQRRFGMLHKADGLDFDFGDFNFDFSGIGKDVEKEMDKVKDKLADKEDKLKDKLADKEFIRETVANAHREAMRAAREARDRARELRVLSRDNGALHSTRIDLGKAQVVYSDDQGELRIENVGGKKVLTAKDREGKLLFSGPVETQEEIDKLPPEVRQRYDKLANKDLPVVNPGTNSFSFQTDDRDNDDNADADDNDDDGDSDNDNGNDNDANGASVEQVSVSAFPRSTWMVRSILL